MVKRIFNKRASRGMAVLMAAAMVGTMSPVSLPTQPTWMVQAATTTETIGADVSGKLDVTVDYVNEKLTIANKDGASATTFYYAIATVKDFDPANVKKYPKASAYEAVAKDDASDIDLSWANLTKDETRLFVTTDPDITVAKPLVKPLAKRNSKLKVAYAPSVGEGQTGIGDDDNGYLVLDDENAKTNPDSLTFDKLEYRTENTDWTDCPAPSSSSSSNSFSLKRFVAKGATLYIREKATADRFAGKAIKVKIAAKAKAPKVTVDYLNHTIKFPKNTEYKVQIGSKSSSSWTAMTDTNAVSIYDTVKIKYPESSSYAGTEAATLTIRTKADKKAPSKETKVVLPAYSDAPDATVAKNDTTEPTIADNKVSIDYVVPYNVDKGIQFTNCSEYPMQFAIVKRSSANVTSLSGTAALNAAQIKALDIANKNKVKWTNVAAVKVNNDDSLKPSVGKITKIDNTDISKITAAEYMVIYRTADKKATVISKIMATELPTKLAQTIAVKSGSDNLEDGKTLQEVKVDANKELEISIDRTVSDKSTYTVAAYKATKGTDNTYAKTDDKKVSEIKATVESGKLTIKATAKAQGNYILNVKCEGAEFNVPVHVFKSTTATITADNTVSAVTVADTTMATAVIGKDKKSVVVTSKAEAASVIVTLTVAAPTDDEPNKTTTVEKTVKIDADGNISVS